MSIREFSECLGVSDRLVSKWEAAREAIFPRPVNQAALDTCLSRAGPDVEARFALLVADASLREPKRPPGAAIARRLDPVGDAQIALPHSRGDPEGDRPVVGDHVQAVAGLTGKSVGWATTGSPNELSPVELFRQLRGMLVDQDNLAGPAHVLPTVCDHVRLIHQLRLDSDGADRRTLLHVQAQYAEFAGWLSQDLGDFQGAREWTSHALEWAHAVGDRDMITYVLARKSQLAGDTADPLGAIDMAVAAQRFARPHSRLKAAGATYEAYGHALAGDATACARAIDRAFALLPESEHTGDSAWAPWLDRSYVEVQAGRCHARLGRDSQAVSAFWNALDALPIQYRRDRGVYLAGQALAHVGVGDIEDAVAVGLPAIELASTTGSHRIVAELARIATKISRWAQQPSVAGFREAFNSVILQESVNDGQAPHRRSHGQV